MTKPETEQNRDDIQTSEIRVVTHDGQGCVQTKVAAELICGSMVYTT